MKRITRCVKVKDSQGKIKHKHEGKPDIYLEKFSASGHLFFPHLFSLEPTWHKQMYSSSVNPFRQVALGRQGLLEHGFCRDKFTFSRIYCNKNSV